jgi:predicted nucleotidyltransferase component of viral defense system
MIPKPYIAKWQNQAPWKDFAQVEQDLIISRTLIALYNDELLRENLAFRGGTALYKLYLTPAPRYSEDIDLVQIKSGPIKPILQRIKKIVDYFEEDRVVMPKKNNNTILYRFNTEHEDIRSRLKIEINCREHFNVLGWNKVNYKMENDWYSGETNITTYHLSELTGTKIRALYQRKKGRDLFDLYHASQNIDLNYDEIIHCYNEYMKFVVGKAPTKKQFVRNIEDKQKDPEFLGDMEALLRIGLEYNSEDAFKWLKTELIEKMK